MIESESSTGEIDRQFLVEMESVVPTPQEPTGIYVPRDPGLAEWEHERIIIHRAVIKDFIHSKDPDAPFMLFLYCFYYEAGRRQETNQPWAVDKFAMKGLGWGKEKFYRVKKKLMETGKIEKKPLREDNKIKKWFVKVNFMSSVSKSPENEDSSTKARVLDSLPVGNQETNALRHQHEMLKDNNKGHVVVDSRIYGKLKIPHDRINVDYGDKDLQKAVALLDAQKNVGNPIGFLIEAIGKKWKSEEPIIQDTRKEDTQKYLHRQNEIADEISKQSTGITDQGIAGLRDAVYKNDK